MLGGCGALAVILTAGCSSGARKPETHAERPAVARDAAMADAASGTGDVQVRVEWRDVPLAARSSPGRTACGAAIAPAVAPTTTWGIPDAFASVDAPGVAPPAARVVYDGCAFAPRVIVARGSLAVTTTADHPVAMTITSRDMLGASSAASRAIQIPIAGHEVDVPIADGVYEVSAGPASAWVVSEKSSAAVTDASGQAVLRGVPAGHHRVTAFLPPRAGQPGRTRTADVDVAPGALAEVTVDISK
ncbi:MAG TPA: hypothetical protein VGF94_19380 [Kofleriaceae bacterium]